MRHGFIEIRNEEGCKVLANVDAIDSVERSKASDRALIYFRNRHVVLSADPYERVYNLLLEALGGG
jgi:hypothetical protein